MKRSLIYKSNVVDPSMAINQVIRCFIQFSKIVKDFQHFTTELTLSALHSSILSSEIQVNLSSVDVPNKENMLKKITAIQSEAVNTLHEASQLESLIVPLSGIDNLIVGEKLAGVLRSSSQKSRKNANDIPTWVPDIKSLELAYEEDLSVFISFVNPIVDQCWDLLKKINTANKIICTKAKLMGIQRMPENASEISVYVDIYVP